jgi:predicted RND superfamily exporter protein
MVAEFADNTDLQLVSQEVKHMKDSFEEFKRMYKEDMAEIKSEFKDRCNSCVNKTKLLLLEQQIKTNDEKQDKAIKDTKEDIDKEFQTMDRHVLALWVVVGFVGGALLTAFIAHTITGGASTAALLSFLG